MRFINELRAPRTIFFLLVALFAANLAQAQSGPDIPCVGCMELTAAPYPESGLWHNPEQSPGSGLNLEIQGGMLAGFIYTYTGTGEPDWLMLSGELEPSQTPGVVWELNTRLTRIRGGSCLSCAFRAPDEISAGMLVQLEFLQRNHLRVRIGENFDQYFVPFTYGSAAEAFFPSRTPYLFPRFPDDTEFLFSLRPVREAQRSSRSAYTARLIDFQITGAGADRLVRYSFREYDPFGPIPSPTPPPVVLRCEVDPDSDQPFCSIEEWGVIYHIPIGNFNDNHFIGEAGDGSILEAFRINYD